ncbi:hypothetical protein [Streptomyces sp. NBC_00102]|uniref:hypothetical protein n=1 Tax=Streptomyces sp. NBC_00102 TaxID=2975652 RepID=UPI00225998D3|nr:hypothetical protein [Streptomyces sp. NBC_00102]MCX5400483.1 hypothetical protein [Streptomyces sp. NBC_00102]
MTKTSRRKLLQWSATTLAMAGLTLGLTTTTASANGTDGWYQFCARGTYVSVVQTVVTDAEAAQGFIGRKVLAMPGQCVSIYRDASPVDIFLRYDDGGEKLLGRAWYQANIATAGYKSTANWYFF